MKNIRAIADTDSEYVDKFFIPGLRKAGDFRAAADHLGVQRNRRPSDMSLGATIEFLD